MSKRTARVLLLPASAAALVIGLSAMPIPATTGPAVQFAFSASAAKATMTAGNASVACSAKGSARASTASATLSTGTGNGTVPFQIGTVTNIKFSNCTGPAGVTIAITPVSEPYPLDSDSEPTSLGQSDVTIGPLSTRVTTPGCSLVVTGSPLGFVSITKHTLTMTPNPPVKPTAGAKLTVSNVSGCSGLVVNGDHATLSAVYTLTPAG